MATLSDISQQVMQEQRLRQADTWFATLRDSINDYATLTITPDGDIQSVNASSRARRATSPPPLPALHA